MYCTDLCKSANDFKLAPAACADFKLHFKLFKWWQKVVHILENHLKTFTVLAVVYTIVFYLQFYFIFKFLYILSFYLITFYFLFYVFTV